MKYGIYKIKVYKIFIIYFSDVSYCQDVFALKIIEKFEFFKVKINSKRKYETNIG